MADTEVVVVFNGKLWDDQWYVEIDKKSSSISYVVHDLIRISLAERPMSIDDLKQSFAILSMRTIVTLTLIRIHYIV